MALALASIGLYGVLSYSVSRRVGEIGVRLALGARRRGIVGLLARDAARIVALGGLVGLAGSVAAARLVGSMLYGLSAGDLTVFVAVTGVLVVVAALATAVPAWRAACTDPLVALRSE